MVPMPLRPGSVTSYRNKLGEGNEASLSGPNTNSFYAIESQPRSRDQSKAAVPVNGLHPPTQVSPLQHSRCKSPGALPEAFSSFTQEWSMQPEIPSRGGDAQFDAEFENDENKSNFFNLPTLPPNDAFSTDPCAIPDLYFLFQNDLETPKESLSKQEVDPSWEYYDLDEQKSYGKDGHEKNSKKLHKLNLWATNHDNYKPTEGTKEEIRKEEAAFHERVSIYKNQYRQKPLDELTSGQRIQNLNVLSREYDQLMRLKAYMDVYEGSSFREIKKEYGVSRPLVQKTCKSLEKESISAYVRCPKGRQRLFKSVQWETQMLESYPYHGDYSIFPVERLQPLATLSRFSENAISAEGAVAQKQSEYHPPAVFSYTTQMGTNKFDAHTKKLRQLKLWATKNDKYKPTEEKKKEIGLEEAAFQERVSKYKNQYLQKPLDKLTSGQPIQNLYILSREYDQLARLKAYMALYEGSSFCEIKKEHGVNRMIVQETCQSLEKESIAAYVHGNKKGQRLSKTVLWEKQMLESYPYHGNYSNFPVERLQPLATLSRFSETAILAEGAVAQKTSVHYPPAVFSYTTQMGTNRFDAHRR